MAFYGHRLHLYRDTVPHEGFTRLLELSNTKKYGTYVFTSNVDGQLFGDFAWDYSRTNAQRDRLSRWMDKLEQEGARLAIVEMGAGTAVPTVRNTSEQISSRFNVPLIRINPRESFGAEIPLTMGAMEALRQISL